MSAATACDRSEEPALLPGYGPVPAGVARGLRAPEPHTPDTAGDPSTTFRAFVRRVLVSPVDGTVNAVESTRRVLRGGDDLADLQVRPIRESGAGEPGRRTFTGALRRLVVARDQSCRTPYCDAPIRHIDHITPVSQGGPTTAANGQGGCERFNYVRELPGWRVRLVAPGGGAGGDGPPGAAHEVEITTPTGHTHRSLAPPALGRTPVPRSP